MRLKVTFAAIALALAGGTGTVAAQERDSAMLDELTRDMKRFEEAVKSYRTTAGDIIKRAYIEKQKSIRSKYEPLIAINEQEEKERRLDAIAAFEAFLLKYPNDKRWTPDAMFRLAELYYEKSSDEFLTAQEAYQKSLDSPNPPTTPSPKPDYNPTVTMYRRLLTEFPNYRLLDAAYYLVGFCLGEMGQEPEAKQALLALTCSNRFKPLDPPPAPTPPNTAVLTARGPLTDTYKGCEPIGKGSKFVPEAWTRIGEMHFDAGELPLAISAYTRVVDYKDSSYYDKALYKLAWSYYRDNRYPEAVRQFDDLVKYADEKKAAGDKFGSDLRPEAVQYLGISFSEPDWDGDTAPDPITGLQRAQDFYKGRENEPHVKEVFQRLGDIYFDQTKYNEAIAVYKALLQKWPHFEDNPRIQDKVVRAYERDRNMIQAAKERESLGRNYSKNSEWWNANRDKPEALTLATQLAEDALLQAATNVHAQAQQCRAAALESKDNARMAECQNMYRSSAEFYGKYLQAYPNSKRTYEYSMFYADALYFGGQLPEAIVAYQTVRDSNLDNRNQLEAAHYVVKVYEEMILQQVAKGQLQDPPIPDEKNTKPPVQPVAVPEVYRKYVEALDWYTNNVKDDKAADMRYAAATVMLKYRNWPEARGRLSQITDAYCTAKPEIGFKAYDALLTTYFIDHNIQDEELKDCALGRLLLVAEQFSASPCSKSPKAAEFTSRLNQIRSSVKSSVIAKRVDLAIKNEDSGANEQLKTCKEGNGGIEVVLGGTRGAAAGTPGKPGAPAAVSTELSEGLALDLIDMVNQAPKDQDAPVNLNNACVTYERIFKYGEATRCYERIAREYPDSPYAKDAVWNAARNHRRFFNFDKAVTIYQQIATDPKFKDSPYRTESLGLAAMLLDNDQQYVRAADFYKRFSEANAAKPQDAAQAHTFACAAYEKAKDTTKHRACQQELIKKFGSQPTAGEYVVGAHMKLAQIVEQSGAKDKDKLAAYQKVRDEYLQRRLPPASPTGSASQNAAAEAAAKAEYLLVESKHKSFEAKAFTNDPKKIKAAFDKLSEEARMINEDYKRVWDYKSATWTTASFLRMGDIYYDFSRKLLKLSEVPPPDITALAKRAERITPGEGDTILAQFRDQLDTFIRPLEDQAKTQWKATLAKAAELNITNEYVKRARENLSRYLPEEFPYIKDEKISLERP